MAYDAFISYSHQADAPRASAVQRALQNLAKPFYRWKTLNVFRDTTSLSANPALWPAIERALERSRYFIVLACPESAASPWCSREIDWWLNRRGPDRFLIVLTGGTLAFQEASGDFDWDRTTCLPRAVSGRFPAEPLYRDLRWAESPPDLTLQNTRFRACGATSGPPRSSNVVNSSPPERSPGPHPATASPSPIPMATSENSIPRNSPADDSWEKQTGRPIPWDSAPMAAAPYWPIPIGPKSGI